MRYNVSMDWRKQAIALPDGLHQAVSQRAKDLAGGTRGLARFVWTIAACDVLMMDQDKLRTMATALRNEYERCEGDLSRLLGDDPMAALTWIFDGYGDDEIVKSVAQLRAQAERIARKRAAKRKGKTSGPA